jgi:sulfur-oxidizing protein SoxA
MKHKFILIFAGLILFASVGAHGVPEEDRKALIDHYKQIFPAIQFDDYIYGSLAMNPEAKEQYDMMMEFPPYAGDVRQGGVLWETPFKNGAKFTSCFKYGGNNIAGGYPYFDDKAGRVITFENAINDCLKTNGEKEMKYGSRDMALLTSYARSLSDQAKINIKIKSAGALAAYEKGKQFYYQRQGQLNFSCATCHVDNAGKFIRSEQLSLMTGQATHWPVFRAGTEPVTLQGRFVGCQKNTRAEPKEINSTEYNNLEFFMTYMSNGLKMQSPVFRK